jgi:hypothetical protein
VLSQVVPRVNMRFANAAARDAAIAVGARKAGMRAFLIDQAVWTQVIADGGSWLTDYRDAFVGGLPSYIGAVPPGGTPKIRKEHTAVVTTNALGGCSFNWLGGSFPNGVVWISVTPGDQTGQLAQVVTQQGNCTLSQWAGQCFKPDGSVVASTTIRLAACAVGW